jgi:hypothetical protein
MRSSKRPSPRLRREVIQRAQGRCEYCLSPHTYATQPFAADHIIPESKSGPTTLENLALACGCNLYKGNRTHAIDLQTGRRVPLFHPRRQKWKRHFAWSADFLHIVGRTQMGRATVEALRMNRPELVNLRRMLHRVGEHPPKM